MGVFGRVIMLMMPITPKFIIRWVANRYVAGPDLESALDVMREISAQGACFTVDVLGEEITTLAEADFFVEEYARVLDAVVAEGLDANISLKPTAFGLLIDQSAAVANIERITRKAAENEIYVRLDMEDHRVTPTHNRPRYHHARERTDQYRHCFASQIIPYRRGYRKLV